MQDLDHLIPGDDVIFLHVLVHPADNMIYLSAILNPKSCRVNAEKAAMIAKIDWLDPYIYGCSNLLLQKRIYLFLDMKDFKV
jgi:hypothetical protein